MDEPIVELCNLTKEFHRGGRIVAVGGVSMRIERGEVVGLIGESGCGKSTVARLVVGALDPTSGEVLVDGADVGAMSRPQRRMLHRRVQMVFQDPYTSLDPRWRVDRIIREPLDAFRVGTRAERDARVHELLAIVGLDASAARQRPHEFSGGQRQRIGIARALALTPDLLVCDEPIAALDVSIQAQIVNLFRSLRRTLGLAMLFIAHDLGMVRHLSDRVAVMYLGRIVEVGPVDAVFDAPQHPYTRLLIRSVPHFDAAERETEPARGAPVDTSPVTAGCSFADRCPDAIARCREDAPDLIVSGDGRSVACHLVVSERSKGDT